MIQHLACVMDGNRRWASQQGLFPWQGHRAGAKTVEVVIAFCLKYKIPYLSLYTFSLENFKRSQEEQSYLFDMIIQQSQSYVPQFIEQGVKVRFIGDLQQFPDTVQDVCQRIEKQTEQGNVLQVNFLFGYGARQEIVAAAQLLAQKLVAGGLLTKEAFEQCLWTAGIPDPDLVIRTGGIQRLSNFLLYQSAYTEIRFLNTLWPDLSEVEILHAVNGAVQAQKNFGK